MNLLTNIAVGSFYGAIDDLVTSTKLLITGKHLSGNAMRQALEGIAISILCAQPGLVKIEKGRGKSRKLVDIKYWEHFAKMSADVQSHKVYGQLELNRQALGVGVNTLDSLKRSIKHNHNFSHAKPLPSTGFDSLYQLIQNAQRTRSPRWAK